jgi:SAM-dependent methyltransferase
VAAFNGPSNTVISGTNAAVESIASQFTARGARVKPLRVSHAFHSPLVDPILDAFQAQVAKSRFAEPVLSLVSSLSGEPAALDQLGEPRYWRDHLRMPVQFSRAMKSLARLGITHFLELSPQPVLLSMGAELVAEAQWLPSLREGQESLGVLMASLQQLYASGVQPDWTRIPDELPRRRAGVPTYPFQRQRHWHQALGRQHLDHLPAAQRWMRVVRALNEQAERGPLDLNAGSYPAKWECLSRLTLAHGIATLRDAGLFVTTGERRGLDGILSVAGIKPTYRHLVRRWLNHMVEAHLLERESEEFTAAAPLADPQLATLWREAEALFADNLPLFDYIRHCGALVGKVLRGEESPLETLFPGGSPDLARGLYERSATMRYINGVAAAVFGTLGDLVPAGRALRVMEVGAGTGGTTSALLPVLDAGRTRYVFTDVSELFLDRARERFADYSFIEYGLYDLEKSPAEQGYAAGSFDVIVSANCVHASIDLRRSLKDLRGMLAPGGLLVLVESTVHMSWFDMTTGLIEGWQHFRDDLRDDNPLLPPETWVEALRDAGFEDVVYAPGRNSLACHLGQHVIVARAPGDASAHLAIAAMGQSGAVAAGSAATTEADPATALREQLRTALPDERLDLLREFVRAQVVRILKLGKDQLPDRHARLMDLGFDSLMAVQLRNQLAQGVGLTRALPATLMFDQPTIEAIARYLLGQTAATAETSPSAAHAVADARVLDERAVAQMSDADIEKLLLDEDV